MGVSFSTDNLPLLLGVYMVLSVWIKIYPDWKDTKTTFSSSRSGNWAYRYTYCLTLGSLRNSLAGIWKQRHMQCIFCAFLVSRSLCCCWDPQMKTFLLGISTGLFVNEYVYSSATKEVTDWAHPPQSSRSLHLGVKTCQRPSCELLLVSGTDTPDQATKPSSFLCSLSYL